MSSRIYAAEDDDNIREILRCTLESYGYEVEVFESAPPCWSGCAASCPIWC